MVSQQVPVAYFDIASNIKICKHRRMRLVLDTNVLVAALRSKHGASRWLLRRVLDGKLVLLATTTVFMEYEAVLKRPEQLQVTGLSFGDIDTILDALASVIVPVQVSYLWRPQLKDPADEMILEASVNGQADWLVTFNLKHFKQITPRFGVQLGTPADVVRAMRRQR